AGVVRAYIESEMYKIEPARKLYYMGPMFRRERPQKGRLRQFHQIGAEALGRADPFIDAEMLLLLHDFFRSTGIRDVSLQLNSLGCVQCRPAYRDQLLAFLKSKEATLCANCRRRMERNPLRVLDCKEPGCIAATQRAPSILQALCSACRDHFEAVQFSLRQAEIAYALNPRMVRGLDYYCRTTFEWTSNQLGAQNAVAAGGRYDGLVEDLGGPLIPGIGFAAGIERLALLLGVGGPSPGQAPDVYLVWVGPQARSWSFPVVHELRQNGIVVEIEGEEKSLKSQMRRADKLKAGLVVIVGEDELRKNAVVVRDMAAKQQIEVPFDRLKAELISRKERR
ncbi:MAG TPA: histidine--tRNA ligase, partial [Candidatus Eisenbacteria bacterium]|nr:histidine--tRNA ligase [Candidatus Eisenbacteria bacterium]